MNEQPPVIAITEPAVEKLSEIIENHANPVAGLRLQIASRDDGKFHHLLSMVEAGAEVPEDVVVDTDTLRVYVQSRDAKYLDGVRINYLEDEDGPHLEFTNPNPLWSDPREY